MSKVDFFFFALSVFFETLSGFFSKKKEPPPSFPPLSLYLALSLPLNHTQSLYRNK